MVSDLYLRLGAREREVFDVVIRQGRATVAQIEAALDTELSRSAIRTMLSRLERKGCVRRRREKGRNVYASAIEAEEARSGTLRRIVSTFFGGSTVDTVAALLDEEDRRLSDDDLARLEGLIRRARREGSGSS